MYPHYNEVSILPPLQPDVDGIGKASDHSTPFLKVHIDTRKTSRKTYKTKEIRPLPQSNVNKMGMWVAEESFDCVKNAVSSTEKVDCLNKLLNVKVEEFFPKKTVKIFHQDKEFMDAKLHRLRRMKSREYRRRGKSEKFCSLQKTFLEMKKKNSTKYVKEKVEALRTSNPSKFFHSLKTLGARPGEETHGTFDIPAHVEKNLTAKEAAEEIACKFSEISNELEPLNLPSLPERVRSKLQSIDEENIPILEPETVYMKMRQRKMKKSTVPGDLPPRLKKEYGPWLAGPATDIFNCINISGIYPRQWVQEYVTPVPKKPMPESEDELRPITIIPDLARDYNNFLADWLKPFLSNRMDPGQLGGEKKCSVLHYLILLYNFIYSETDNPQKEKNTVIAALLDFSKGFTRVSYTKVLIRLSDWGVPGWLLRILASYLTDRSMIVRYKGAQSNPHPLPSGGPQGDVLGMIIFLVEVSDVGMPPPPPLPPDAVEEDVSCVPAPPPPAQTRRELRLKWLDDVTLAESIQLNINLCSTIDRSGRKQFHERNNLILPPQNSILQTRLNELSIYVQKHKMKINTDKTKIMPFNFTKKYDFIPELCYDNQILDVTYTTKLLGVMCSSDGKWNENVVYVAKKANSRLFFLRRLKALGASRDTLKEVYVLFVDR